MKWSGSLVFVINLLSLNKCCLQVDVQDDEEQHVALQLCLELLVAAGYFRARIQGLSPFDKVLQKFMYFIRNNVNFLILLKWLWIHAINSNFYLQLVGGMAWCIETCCVDLDVDLLYHDSLTIGQKIGLTERLVSVLHTMQCPHDLQPHQVQGLDAIHILPVMQVSNSIRCRVWIQSTSSQSCRSATPSGAGSGCNPHPPSHAGQQGFHHLKILLHVKYCSVFQCEIFKNIFFILSFNF